VSVTNDARVDDGFQAITSLSRALDRRVEISDVGSLMWVLLGQMVPCDALALFTPDDAGDALTIRFAAGAHAREIEGIRRPAGSGIAGWVARHRRTVVNAEPVFDLGVDAPASRALRSSAVVPLVDNGRIVAVLALYSKSLLAFTDDHVSMLELLGPRLALTLSAWSAGVADDALTIVPHPVLHLVPRETRLPLHATDNAGRSL
jgi:GAF domain-containing protein